MEGVSVVPDCLDNDVLKSNVVIENNEMIANPKEAQKKFIMEQDEREKKYREYIRGKISITNQHVTVDDQQITVLKDTSNYFYKYNLYIYIFIFKIIVINIYIYIFFSIHYHQIVNRLTQELARYQKKYPPVIDVPLSEVIIFIILFIIFEK